MTDRGGTPEDRVVLRRGPSGTLDAVEFPTERWKDVDTPAYLEALRKVIARHFETSARFYRQRQRARWSGLQALRAATVLAGVAGILLTAASAVTRYAHLGEPQDTSDAALLLAALIAYALMTALAFAERGLELSGSYFRAVVTVLALRNLRNRYVFEEEIAAQTKSADADAAALRTKSLERARDFCIAMDTITTNEATAWQNAFQDAAKSLADVAATGLGATSTRVDAALKKIAEDRAAEQKKRDEEATLVALSVKIDAKTAGGTSILFLDGTKIGEGAQHEFAFAGLARGTHVLKLDYRKGEDQLVFERNVDLTARITTETVDLP